MTEGLIVHRTSKVIGLTLTTTMTIGLGAKLGRFGSRVVSPLELVFRDFTMAEGGCPHHNRGT